MDQICWLHCKQSLLEQLDEDDSAWIKPLKLETLSATEVVFSGVPNHFFQQRITSKYLSLLALALQTHFKTPCSKKTHRFHLRLELKKPTSAIPTEEINSPQLINGKTRKTTVPSYSTEPKDALSEVIIYPGIAKAVQLSQQIIEKPGEKTNPLLLMGSSGGGKTRLLRAIAYGLRKKGLHTILISGEDWKQTVLRSIYERQGLALQSQLQMTEVLLLDGLEDLLVSPRSQETLQHLLDNLGHQQAQIVFSCYQHPSQLTHLIPSLRSRLTTGVFCQLQPPEPKDALTLLKHWAHQHLLTLDTSTLCWLSKMLNSPRSLQGAITLLAAYHQPKPLSLAQSQQLLDPWLNNPEPSLKSPAQILKQISNFFSLTPQIISSRQKTKQVALARSMSIYLLKQQNLSYQEIGRLLGGRTASSMLKNHQRLQEDIIQKPKLKKILRELNNSLQNMQAKPFSTKKQQKQVSLLV